jgi:hypothetical protein
MDLAPHSAEAEMDALRAVMHVAVTADQSTTLRQVFDRLVSRRMIDIAAFRSWLRPCAPVGHDDLQ